MTQTITMSDLVDLMEDRTKGAARLAELLKQKFKAAEADLENLSGKAREDELGQMQKHAINGSIPADLEYQAGRLQKQVAELEVEIECWKETVRQMQKQYQRLREQVKTGIQALTENQD
jgi:flagellar biosynthesis chaperone FliJ